MSLVLEILLRQNECVVQLSDKNLLQSYHVLQEIVTMLGENVGVVPLPESRPSNTTWVLRPKPESISQELEVDGIYDHPLLLFCNDAFCVMMKYP
jgi:hypothetical protein